MDAGHRVLMVSSVRPVSADLQDLDVRTALMRAVFRAPVPAISALEASEEDLATGKRVVLVDGTEHVWKFSRDLDKGLSYACTGPSSSTSADFV